jgi:hypothetical protein
MKDIRQIIEGSALEISLPNPFEEGVKWYLRQPEDFEADLALAVRNAAQALASEQEEIRSAATQPPSRRWLLNHKNVSDATRKQIAELEAQGDAIDPLDKIELENKRDLLETLADPSLYTRADEEANAYARKRYDEWLIKRLVFSEMGKVYLDPDSKEGPARWKALNGKIRIALKLLLYEVLALESTAKN